MSKRNRGAKKMMKNDENGQLSCGICSYPAAARSPLQGWVGDRCRDRSIRRLLSGLLRYCLIRWYDWRIDWQNWKLAY